MTETTNGWTWQVLDFEFFKNGRRRGDGDTFNVLRKTKQLLGDKWKWVMDVDHEPIRLPWVDTPESHEYNYMAAANDLTTWINRALALGPVQVVCFGTAGWDRELGDLINAEGESAAQWMMTHGNFGRGWPLYER